MQLKKVRLETNVMNDHPTAEPSSNAPNVKTRRKKEHDIHLCTIH